MSTLLILFTLLSTETTNNIGLTGNSIEILLNDGTSAILEVREI